MYDVYFPFTKRGMLSELLVLTLVRIYCEENHLNLKILASNYNAFASRKFIIEKLKIPVRRSEILSYDLFETTLPGKLIHRISKSVFGNRYTPKELFDFVWNSNFSDRLNDSSYFKYKIKDYLASSLVIDDFSNTLCKGSYNCIHVRRGDKLICESKYFDVDFYISKLKNKSLPLIILTDDYTVVDEAQMNYDYPVYTMCKIDNRGYDNAKFSNISAFNRDIESNCIITDINLGVNACQFVGVYASNMSRVIAILRDFSNCSSVDGNFKYVW
jgi:hypothetical protein